jgi:hypothetical protein
MKEHAVTAFTADEDVDPLFVQAKDAWAQRLFGTPAGLEAVVAHAATTPRPEDNVVGVGIGEKTRAGRPTGILAIKFLVRHKYALGNLAPRFRLPATIDGLPADVEEVGTFTAHQNPRAPLRPAPPGSSVGFVPAVGVMAGTFGALVTDGASQFVLSSNHVLADLGRVPVGAPILQPGTLDRGRPNLHRLASLDRFVPIQQSGNRVDAALARVLEAEPVTNCILFIGPPRGVAPARRNMIVHKYGRTTDYTVGLITSVNTNVRVQYGANAVIFDDQIVIQGLAGAFSAEGDSGSLIVERNSGAAVGLLFGGSPVRSLANHLGVVLPTLGVTLV